MNITFNQLSLRNFMSFGNQPTVIDLDKHATTLFVAENGVGKTAAVYDALMFALTGNVSRKMKNGQIVNSINMQDCEVKTTFAVGSSKYQIARGLAPGFLRVHRITDEGNEGVELFEKSSINEKNSEIEKLFGVPIGVLLQLAFVGIETQSFLSRTPAARRELIDNVLGITIFSQMLETVKLRRKRVEGEIVTIQRDLNAKRSTVESLDDILVRCREPDQDIIREASNVLDRDRPIFNNLREEYKTLKEEYTTVESELSNAEADRDDIHARAKTIKSTPDKCPSCGSDIDREAMRPEMDSLRTKNDEITTKIAEIKSRLTPLSTKYDEMHSQLTELQQRLQAAKATLDEEESVDTSAADEVHSKIKVLQDEIIDLEVREATLSEQLEPVNELQVVLQKGHARSAIVESYLPFINEQINSYLHQFGMDLFFSFDKDFKESFKARYKTESSYASFSAGQQNRLDFAMLLTWRDLASKLNSVETNLFLVDEFGARLDDAGLRDCVDLVASQDGLNFIAMAPRELEADFDRVVRLKNEKNFATLVQ